MNMLYSYDVNLKTLNSVTFSNSQEIVFFNNNNDANIVKNWKIPPLLLAPFN